jgi:signal transduction histidine kinase
LTAQNQAIDSMYQVLKTTKNDTIRSNTHYELAWFLKLSDFQKAMAHMDTAMASYEKLKMPNQIALSHFQYSVLHRISGEYEKAIQSLDAYKAYIEKVKDTINLTYAHYEKGVIYSQKGDLEASLQEFYISNTLAEGAGNDDMAGNSMNSIGLVYNDLEKYEEAINAFEKVLVIYKRINVTTEQLGDVYNGLGSSYKNLEKYDTAQKNYEKALDVYQNSNSEFGVAIANYHLGRIHIEQKQYKEAIPFLNLAYDIQKKNDFESEFIKTLSSLGEAYYELGDYKKSETILQEGLAFEIENKLSAKELYFELYRVNAKINETDKALAFHEKYTLYKDSIYKQENIESINRLQQQFETEKKDKEIAMQNLELQEKEMQMNYLYGLSIFLLLLTFLLWFLYKQRQKRKNQEILTLKREYQIKSLEALIEGEEKERFRIAKELHDGVNGDLSTIKYKLSSLLEMNNKVIKEAITMIDDSCKQVRAISHNLVPPSLENFSVTEATEAYCDNMNAVNTVAINFQTIGQETALPKKAEINIFRIVQELVTNSLKHAEANEINVQISFQNNLVQVTVEDDGKGFDKNAVGEQGIGLSNIDSRAKYLNASVDFISNEKGTSYTFEIDIQKLNDN